MRLSDYLARVPYGRHAALIAGDIAGRSGKLLPALGENKFNQHLSKQPVVNHRKLS